MQTGKGGKKVRTGGILHIDFFLRYLFYMLICSYFKVFKKYIFITLYVQN